jgi:hypothetical protein
MTSFCHYWRQLINPAKPQASWALVSFKQVVVNLEQRVKRLGPRYGALVVRQVEPETVPAWRGSMAHVQ